MGAKGGGHAKIGLSRRPTAESSKLTSRNRLRLLNRRYCQQSGSMSAAQVCGGENDAEGDCRQSQSQLDRVSFAHLSKLLLPDALAFEVAAGDRRSIFFTPAFRRRRARRNKHRKSLRPPADGAHASDGRRERNRQATWVSGDEFVDNHSRSLQRAALGGANSRRTVRTPFQLAMITCCPRLRIAFAPR